MKDAAREAIKELILPEFGALNQHLIDLNRRIDETNKRIDALTLEVGELKAEIREMRGRQETIADILKRLQKL
ncbi:MAG: hypothetical protein GXO66_01775 [Euryarchaeota archaeon]|nr:hypothetical protein [Euryarchaeota archaeon]